MNDVVYQVGVCTSGDWLYNNAYLALVAQLDRASVSGTEGRAFESRRVHLAFCYIIAAVKTMVAIAQLVRAPLCESGGRGFESR